MRIRMLVAGGLLAILMAAATAAATSGSVEMRFDSPGQITGIIDGTLTGSDAQQARGFIDQFGNDDGTVSENEVASAERTFMDFAQAASNQDDGEGATGGDFTIDGKGPSKLEFTVFDIRNAEGPVTSTAPINIKMEVRLIFPVDGRDRHTVHLNTTGSDDGDDNPFGFELASAKVLAPKGYIFESVTGLPSGASSDDRTIDLGSSYGQESKIVIVLAKGGGGFAPAAGVVLVAVMLAGAAALRRRE